MNNLLRMKVTQPTNNGTPFFMSKARENYCKSIMEVIVLGIELHFAPFIQKLNKLIIPRQIKEQTGLCVKNFIYSYG